MEPDSHEFKRLREEFADQHRHQTRSLEAHMNEAKRLLESDLAAGGVHHTPISARLKDQEKALRTLDRRQDARKELQSLKTMVQERGSETWEQYCRVWNMEDKIHEAKPFNSVNQMFEAMHDLAGIRVSLYFPDDVQKVVDLLRDRFEIVEGPTRKGGLTRDFQKVRKLVEEQRQDQEAVMEGHGDLGSLETTNVPPESPFGGYRATHVVIRHKDNFDRHVSGDGKINIEVQIGSIIMHAWSDIEHDILYKPSYTGTASPDVKRMLDLINGIVMTGEVALQQLASISAAERTRKVEDRTQKAMGPRYMTPWLDKYFMVRKKTLPANSLWMSTGFLFDVLKATNEHHYGRLEELLNEMNPKPVKRLPVLVLHHLGRNTHPFQENRPHGMDSIIVSAWSARYWATCLVNTLNLAIYMGSGPSMFDAMKEHIEKDDSLHNLYPTFAEILDILHPTITHRRPTHEGHMIEFCRSMLATTFEPESHALAAMKLASAGYVARPRLSEEEEVLFGSKGPPIFVPARLKRMKPDTLCAFRIMLSTIDEDIQSENEYLYFVPRLTDDEYDCSWKPVSRQSGKWDIVRAPFDYNAPIHFEEDNLNIRHEVDHLRRALGVKMEAKEIRGLRSLAKALHIDQVEHQLRLIVMITRVLDTTNTDKIRSFKKLLDSEKVEDTDEMTMLAVLKHSNDTKDPDDLKRYLQLSRSVRTTNLTELSAYRRLERDHGTQDIGRLKKLRSKQKNAERARSQHNSRLGDDLMDCEDSVSENKSAISAERSDDENYNTRRVRFRV